MTPRRSHEYLRADLRKMLLFIHWHTRRHGFGPTYSEIGDRMGYGSIGPVQYRLGMLQREGWIARIPGQARAIRIIRLPYGQSIRIEQNMNFMARIRDTVGDFAAWTGVRLRATRDRLRRAINQLWNVLTGEG